MKVKVKTWALRKRLWVTKEKTYEDVYCLESYPSLEGAERWTVKLVFQDGRTKTIYSCCHISIEDNVTEADDDPKEIMESYKRGETPKFVRKLLDMKEEEDI